MPEWPHTYADHQQAAVGHLPGSGGGASSNSSNHSGQQQHDFYALDARQQKCYAHPYYQGPPQVVPSSVHSGEPWSHPPFPLTTLPQHPVVQTNSSDTYAATPFTNHCSNADAVRFSFLAPLKARMVRNRFEAHSHILSPRPA